jgi:tetratricopeptide (TPR) repeat protein
MLPGEDADPAIARYHRWLLDPECDAPDEVRAGLGSYAPLVDVVAYTIGLSDNPPDVAPDAPADLRAVVASAQAAAFVERGELEGAAGLLQGAAYDVTDSAPLLAGTLFANAGSLLRQAGHNQAAVAALEAARELLTAAHDAARDADDDVAQELAEVHHELGIIAHENLLAQGLPLQEAMGHYYAGLKLVSERSAPLIWAGLQLDLAIAQLATPMRQATDRLRLGIAAQSLRAARRVFTPQQHPVQWAGATLNLASALVYLPSTHQGDNLVEAVELYEEVLASGLRDAETDPAGRARLLANQGNALAHLGIFDQARAKLVEARFLFESVLDHDGVLTVRSVLDEIVRAGIGYDPEEAAADLARQTEQMSKMPSGLGRTSGMGVTILPAARRPTMIPAAAQNRAKVTVIPVESVTVRRG